MLFRSPVFLAQARAVNSVISAPPSDRSGHSTYADFSAGQTSTPEGFVGSVGVFMSADTPGAEVPPALVAVTEKVYAVPLVSPLTVHDSAPVVSHD